MADDQVSLTIDGQEVTVPTGTLVIRAAERLHITIPRFCDHPLLAPAGACRQCFVDIALARAPDQPRPMTSCTTEVAEGMVVNTHLTSDVARQAQEAQLEFLLINHPLDCPMCDKGGECPLQDQALAHGPSDSRFVDRKRRYEKPVPISPQIGLDRERCVLCARCTRFSSEISGDPFIELFERGALEQVAIYEDEPYHSYFSGNVVQICPVGALTASSYRFAARPFDVRAVDGVCNQCASGCNLRIDTRSGRIERQLARTNMAVNEAWNCDKGRFGFAFVAHPTRITEPAARDELGSVTQTSWTTAIRAAADRLAAARDAGGVGVLTGGNLTDEDAYAVSRFARDVLGTDDIDFRRIVRTDEERPLLEAVAGAPGPTYDEIERAGVVVVAGLDPEEESPILHLRLRKAANKLGVKVVAVGPALGSISDVAWRWVRTGPGGETRILRALAGTGETPREGSDLAAVAHALADADEAASGGPGVIVLAGERLATSPGALAAAAQLASAGTGRGFAWVPRKAGARGAVDAGLLPGLLPGGRAVGEPGPVADAWSRVPDTVGRDAHAMLRAAADGELSALYLIGVDPIRDFEDTRLAERALERVESVIVQDLLETDTTRYADVVLPAAASQERVGSFTTWEGRRQPFAQVMPPPQGCLEDWDIIRQLARVMGADLGWETAMDVRREAAPLMAAERSPADRLADLAAAAPDDEGDRQRAERAAGGDLGRGRAERAAGGDLIVEAVPSLLGRGSMLRGADALNATARTPRAWVHPEDAERAGVADGDEIELAGPVGRLRLPVVVTEQVAPGVVRVPRNAMDTPLGVLVDPDAEPGAPLRARLGAPNGSPPAGSLRSPSPSPADA